MRNQVQQRKSKIQLYKVFSGAQNKESIFISNYLAAMSPQLLQKNQIQAILTIAKGCFLTYSTKQIPHYLYIPIEDKPTTQISQYFSQCFAFLDKARKQTNVLVHCKAGVSRSATIIIAYFMSRFKIQLCQSYQILRKVNSNVTTLNIQIRPNYGFQKQLQEFEMQVFKNEGTKDRKQKSEKRRIKHNSIFEKAQNLQTVQCQIQGRLTKINSLIQKSNLRKKSHSTYLSEKMEQLKKKKENTNKLVC